MTCAVAIGAAALLALAWIAAWPLLARLDNGLEADMPRYSLRARLRAYLGIDVLIRTTGRAAHRIHHLEEQMATATEQLTALNGKVDDLIGDVRAALATINQDDLSAEAQTALDGLTAKIEAFDAEVGDADGSDVPAEPLPGDEN